MFQLIQVEIDEFSRSQTVTLKRGHNIKNLPYAFTENGVAMLSTVLKSDRAIEVNIQIMRTFTKIRKLLTSNAALARKLKALEKKYDEQFAVVFEAIYKLMEPPEKKKRRLVLKEERSNYQLFFNRALQVQGIKGNLKNGDLTPLT